MSLPADPSEIYLGFDPADRGGAWRTELRNALDAILERHKEAEHDLRVALRATTKRIRPSTFPLCVSLWSCTDMLLPSLKFG